MRSGGLDMALNKFKLGQLISLCTGGNENLRFDESFVKGISVNKEFIPTKADLSGVSLSNYTVVNPKCFSFVTVTSRNGNKISIAYNNSSETFIVSSFYVTFRLSEFGKTVLLEEYLHMFFNRSEFDRYARRDSWGSAREYFYFENICNVDITLPDIDTQRKYVDIYNAMVSNQRSFEHGLEDLKLVCDGYIEELRRKTPCQKIGQYIRQSQKNKEEKIDNVLGIGQAGFIKPQKEPNESLKNYKIIENGMIGYAPPLYNMLTGAIHYYDEKEPAVCSPIYEVFECINGLLPDYLILWLKREEFKRYAEYFSAGVRGTFDFELMEEVEIPIPDIKIQKAIANVYNTYIERKKINEQLKAQIKNICPVLIKGSLEEDER